MIPVHLTRLGKIALGLSIFLDYLYKSGYFHHSLRRSFDNQLGILGCLQIPGGFMVDTRTNTKVVDRSMVVIVIFHLKVIET